MSRRAHLIAASALLAPAVALAQGPLPAKPLDQVPTFAPATPTAKPPTTPAPLGTISPAGGPLPGGPTGLPTKPALPVATPPDAGTIKHLEGWEGAMKGMSTFYAAATMTETSGKREAAWDINIWLLAPTMARMDMNKPPAAKGKEPTLEKMVISTGKTIYEYDGPRKVRTSAALGPGGAGNNLMLDLMSGMSPKQVTDRFTVKTLKVDADFVYLEVKPVYAADKEEFDKLTLVLCGEKYKAMQYVPRMIVLDRPDGQTKETWDFNKPVVNPKGITAETFNPVPLDKGWTDDRKELPKGTSTGGLKAPLPK